MTKVSEKNEGNNANTVLCAVIESTAGYSCPNCGAICSDKTLISRTEAEFEELPNPHYSWEETHKCQKCETLYLLHIGLMRLKCMYKLEIKYHHFNLIKPIRYGA